MSTRAVLCSFTLAILCACKPEGTTESPDTAPAVVVEDQGTPTSTPPADEGGDGGPLSCERPADFGPVVVSAEQYAHRLAAGATKFSEVASTKEQPLEECGIRAGIERMAALTCDDGSSPFKSLQEAHSSRAGNVGGGGRCGSIIDLYQAKCPEATYDIYIDGYICADPQMFE